MNIISKLNHWSIFLLALFLGITGIFGCTIFSHDSIVPNLEYAYGINEIQSGKASQFFISKLFRGLMWNWHYYAGLAITLLLFVNMLLAFYRPRRIKHSWMNFRKNPYPILMLLIRPGRTVREYLNVDREKYVKPIVYLVFSGVLL